MPDKALLMGINVYRSVPHLRGCVNDVEDMQRLLLGECGFEKKYVRTLIDNGQARLIPGLPQELVRILEKIDRTPGLL